MEHISLRISYNPNNHRATNTFEPTDHMVLIEPIGCIVAATLAVMYIAGAHLTQRRLLI